MLDLMPHKTQIRETKKGRKLEIPAAKSYLLDSVNKQAQTNYLVHVKRNMSKKKTPIGGIEPPAAV
jgi:hypothetical protein